MNWLGVGQFAVFERLEDGQSQIALLRLDIPKLAWEAEPTILSSTPESHPQRRPDCSMSSYHRQTGPTSWSLVNLSLVAWERLEAGHWNIWYTFQPDTGQQWSAPRPLTSEARDNTFVQVRGGEDSSFVVTWQADSLIYATRIGPDGEPTVPETLGVSNFTGFRHHTITGGWFGGFRVVWTIRTDSGVIRAVNRHEIPTWQGGDLSEPDTLPDLEGLTGARLAINPVGGSIVFYEQELNLGWTTVSDLFAWSEYGYDYPENITGEPDVLDRNPSSFSIPVVTQKPAAQLAWFDILAYERINRAADWADSGIVIRTYGMGDTIRGPGYARSPCVGSMFFPSPYSPYHSLVPIVWESGVGSQTQIYGAFVEIFFGAVGEESGQPERPMLHQNYPNPFNPATTIEYTLPHLGHVTLKVYNVLGEIVATLADGDYPAGSFKTTWDASGLPSGVYFYRLSAGAYSATRKAILAK